ncbi:RICIN domain-containing protein, partial [Streptomyces nigra]
MPAQLGSCAGIALARHHGRPRTLAPADPPARDRSDRPSPVVRPRRARRGRRPLPRPRLRLLYGRHPRRPPRRPRRPARRHRRQGPPAGQLPGRPGPAPHHRRAPPRPPPAPAHPRARRSARPARHLLAVRPSRGPRRPGRGAVGLDVDNAGTADGTKVQIWTCNSSAAQRWTIGD